jgi:hypothetical protein
MKSKPKEYNIDSFERLSNVINEHNLGNLIIDIANVFSSYLSYIKDLRIKYPKETKGKQNSQILKLTGFTWIDDNKNEIKEIKVENKFTGEVYLLSKKK